MTTPRGHDGPEAGFLNPANRPYRFIVLFFVSVLTFGSYFAYDSVGAIAPMLIDALGIGRESIGQMYTLYSVAAILSVFIGGLLIDRFGTRKASLLFSALVTLGALIVALAPNLLVLYAGRFIFGWGSESLVVAQSAIFARWFKGRELALSFGIGLTISRLGTLFSFNTEALIAEHFNDYRYALWAAVGFCLLSLLSNLVYNMMDRRGERVLELKEEGGGDKIVFGDIKKFTPSYWYVTLLCVTFYSAIFPFTALSTDLFNTKWGLPMTAPTEGGFLYQAFYNILHMFTTAGGTTTIIIFASMVFAPVFGQVVDKFGKRAAMMVDPHGTVIPSPRLYDGGAGVPHDHPGDGIRSCPCGDVAINTAACGKEQGGNRVWPDDDDTEHRPRLFPLAQWVSPRHDGFLHSEHGHVLLPRDCGADFCHCAETCRCPRRVHPGKAVKRPRDRAGRTPPSRTRKGPVLPRSHA